MSTSLLVSWFWYCWVSLYPNRVQERRRDFLRIQKKAQSSLRCPVCKNKRIIKHSSHLRWFHSLPIGKKATYIKSEITRVECKDCKTIRQSDIGSADPRFTYTRALGRYVLDLARHMTIVDVKRMMKGLVIQALFRAVSVKRPEKRLILHSDRGSQYCSQAFAIVLKQFDMKPSTSRKGNCYDNAPIKSFWGTLKTEMVHHRKYASRKEAESEIREYIEIFYNRQRIQKRLVFCSPAAFERKYLIERNVAERFGFHY